MNAQDAWMEKAHRLIAAECLAAYLSANTLPNGKMRSRYAPYHVPEFSRQLVECLRNNDKERAQALFLSYDGLEVTKLASTTAHLVQ